MTTLVRGARVLTLDAADTEHAKADIVIEGTMSPRSARSSVARRRRDPYGMNSSSGRLRTLPAIRLTCEWKCPLSDRASQSGLWGGNARRLYRIDPPKKIIRDRVTEIQRPNWWPTEDEVKAALAPTCHATPSGGRA